MATFPGFRGALLLWGLFGISTVLLFWAALIRATREWGGDDSQGRAYGLLDGGRGLLAAVLATLAVGVFGLAFPDGYASASEAERRDALRVVILGYTAATALAGLLVWFVIGRGESGSARWRRGDESLAVHVGNTLKIPAVWLQSIIIVCAYVGYKGFDNYSLYAVQGYGLDQVDAAGVAALGAWMRPIAALCAGLLGDRLGVGRMTLAAFVLLLASHLVFALDTPSMTTSWLLFGNTLVTCAAIFGLRGLYFALFQEARVPLALTGTAVGLVSVVGYTPDIFVAWVGGMLLDRSPGLAGHQDYFMFLAAFSLLGVVASTAMLWLVKRTDAASSRR